MALKNAGASRRVLGLTEETYFAIQFFAPLMAFRAAARRLRFAVMWQGRPEYSGQER